MRKVLAGGKSDRVCLISQHPLVLGRLRDLLQGAALDIQSCRIETKHLVQPDTFTVGPATVHVLDLCAVPRITAERLASVLMSHKAPVKLIVLFEELEAGTAFPLLRIGAKGLLAMAELEGQFVRAVKAVAAGGYWVPRSTLAEFVDWLLASVNHRKLPSGSARLSARQRDVLNLLLENLSNKEIADKLHISEATAKFHVSNLLSKYGVQRRADLMVLCYQLSPEARMSMSGSVTNVPTPD